MFCLPGLMFSLILSPLYRKLLIKLWMMQAINLLLWTSQLHGAALARVSLRSSKWVNPAFNIVHLLAGHIDFIDLVGCADLTWVEMDLAISEVRHWCVMRSGVQSMFHLISKVSSEVEYGALYRMLGTYLMQGEIVMVEDVWATEGKYPYPHNIFNSFFAWS